MVASRRSTRPCPTRLGIVILLVLLAIVCPPADRAHAQMLEELAALPAPAGAPPTITITTPTGVSAGVVALQGTATGAISQVTWTSDGGGAGVASGTSEWQIDGVALQPGANVITVTAQDTAGRVAQATITVTSTIASAEAPASAPDALPAAGAPSLRADADGIDATRPGPTFTAPSPFTTAPAPTLVIAPAPAGTSGAVGPRAAVSSTARASDVTAAVSSAGQPGLVAAYAFDEGAGATATDLSGNNNTGTLHGGVAWTAQGRLGSALLFRGSGMVTVPHSASLALTSGMTIEAWVYPTTVPTHWMTAVLKENGDEPAYALFGGSPSGRPGARYTAASHAANAVNGPGILAAETWAHLATTFDGTTLRLYVDGVQVASRPGAGSIISSTGALRIGGSRPGLQGFRGRIDEVRVYNRALSAAEIQTDMVRPIKSGTPPLDVTPPSVTSRDRKSVV